MSSPVSAKATRRELNARQAETVERVAVAAREELKAVGFEGLTVRSVASRAEVAPATAYTYFSSKNHLVAEIFWRRLSERPHVEVGPGGALERVIRVFDDLTLFLEEEPELAAATTTALLGSDPDVVQLRLLIGTEINSRIVVAAGPETSAAVKDVLELAWAGAMLQVGMGHAPVEQMGARLADAARLLMAAGA